MDNECGDKCGWKRQMQPDSSRNPLIGFDWVLNSPDTPQLELFRLRSIVEHIPKKPVSYLHSMSIHQDT